MSRLPSPSGAFDSLIDTQPLRGIDPKYATVSRPQKLEEMMGAVGRLVGR